MRTHVTFVLDSSGSMSKIRDDTIGGFNEFLADQQKGEGEVTVTLYDFNTGVESVYHGKAIANAPELDEKTYTPGGRTALHDALATAITETDRRIEKTPAGIRPENVIVVTLTDGKENASETPHDRVHELVEGHREEHDWEFLFIGANQDAALAATGLGMDADRSLDMNHSGEGTHAAYQSTSERLHHARREGTTGGYEKEDRRRQQEADSS
ncbi:VWA domain-containing protein [Halobacteriales archaeon QS_4_69_34]|nr:MAG: VWA domain-containing protein [Halobacteriales archaeon QS_4_69_34]